jgi:EAL domain-containing protein (putative c-di-GMP-specific phosphodiesterase class I)/GGDEF domain-containing protein
MASSATGVATRGSQLLSPQTLLAELHAQCSERAHNSRIVGLLMLDLRRADRIGALMATAEARRLLDDVFAALGRSLRPEDRFSSITHDEIWVMLPDLGHAGFAVLAANRVLTELQRVLPAFASQAALHPCIGIACFPQHATEAVQLVECADLARRAAFDRADGYAVFEDTSLTVARGAELESDLRSAVRTNAIDVYYQPQVCVRTGQCTSAEALLRWWKPTGEAVSPAIAAGIAERTDILQPLTVLILNTALRHAADFRRGGQAVRVSVNLSPKLIGDEELPELVMQLIETWNVPVDGLTLEVTEGAVFSDVARAEEMLKRLKAYGVRLAMDDFGTGYSSLAQLKRFPFDEIKIDKVFVQNLCVSEGDARIVRAMIELARAFQMEVVAEGVENEATLERLREMGCDLAQGFLFAKALPAADFRAWWRTHHAALIRSPFGSRLES